MAGNYIIEVHPNYRLQPEIGFFHHGQGTKAEPFHIVPRHQALTMNLDFAKTRTEMVRASGLHRARITDVDGRIITDWNQDVNPKQEEITRFNQHVFHEYRGLRFIEDRATGKFHHRFAWPVAGGEERSVSGTSCEDVVQRLLGMPGDVGDYMRANLDRVEVSTAAPSTPAPAAAPVINVAIPPGYAPMVEVSYRPGNPTR